MPDPILSVTTHFPLLSFQISVIVGRCSKGATGLQDKEQFSEAFSTIHTHRRKEPRIRRPQPCHRFHKLSL